MTIYATCTAECPIPCDGRCRSLDVCPMCRKAVCACPSLDEAPFLASDAAFLGDEGWVQPLVPQGLPDVDPFDVDRNQPMTDLGNARRLVSEHGRRLRFVVPWRKWLVWDDARWSRDLTGEAQRCAKAIARELMLAAQALPDDPGDKEGKSKRDGMLAAARRAESANGIRGMLELAGTELGIALSPEMLDRYPDLLNVANGVLELPTGVLHPHDPNLNLSKVTAAAYDPQAQAPEFVKFLERVQPDAEMREFLARLLGHALSGRIREHILPVFHGIGANGKSTLVEVVRRLLGDYAATVDPGLLIDRGEVHPTGVADLHGLRLAITHESDQGRRLAEGTIKRLTGGDAVTARRMREDFWTFEPTHSLVMVTNHAPVVTGTDEGIWRRLKIIPFGVVIPPEERDPDLPTRLDGERDGILRWLVEGYRAYLAEGLAEPGVVATATTSYRQNSDLFGLWLDERTLSGAHYWVRSSELYADWARWAGAEGMSQDAIGTQKAFTSRLVEKGYDPPTKSHGVMRWSGIGLGGDADE